MSNATTLSWGKLQRECHAMMTDLFDTQKEAYTWLFENFGIHHFSELMYSTDRAKLEAIYEKLYVRSFFEGAY